ncbi:MAG: hypothetical protein LH649_09560, partial [Pseudanabaena sp. CAN_BIN31]|nr:hypothetical protein [Pseudanabaena sp. CAN_BIN31]
MSKINKPSQSDDSNSKLPKSVISQPPTKDLPKLEVVKVIAPKAPESTQLEEQKLVSQKEEPIKSVLSLPKIIPASARVKTPTFNRYGDVQSDLDNRSEDFQEPKVYLQPIP